MSGPSPATRLSLLDLRHFLKARLALPNGSSTILYVYLDETEQKLQGHNGDLEGAAYLQDIVVAFARQRIREAIKGSSLSLSTSAILRALHGFKYLPSAFASDDADISKVRSSHSGWNYLSLMS